MKTATEKLIEEITKHGEVTTGTESTTKNGEKYRYDIVRLKYKHSARWIANLFKRAAAENGNEFGTQFFYKNYSFHFDRAKFKGQPNGKVSFSILIKL